MRSYGTSLDFVFKAVADPTRRAILDLLFVSERSVRELTASFSISQPGISQHLRELRKARLVSARRVHREQRYSLTAEPLRKVYDWSMRYRAFFDPAGHAWAFVVGEPGGAVDGRIRGESGGEAPKLLTPGQAGAQHAAPLQEAGESGRLGRGKTRERR